MLYMRIDMTRIAEEIGIAESLVKDIQRCLSTSSSSMYPFGPFGLTYDELISYYRDPACLGLVVRLGESSSPDKLSDMLIQAKDIMTEGEGRNKNPILCVDKFETLPI